MESNESLTDILCSANRTELLKFLSFGNDSEFFLEQYNWLCGIQNPENTTGLENVWVDYPGFMNTSKLLRTYVPPVLLIFGTLGNVLSFLVLIRKSKSTYLYLAALAVLDLLVLYVGLMRLWIAEFTVDLQNATNWLCKGVNYLGYVSSDCSVWIIIAVTFERFVAVCFPMKAPQICKRSRTKIVISVIILTMCALNFPILLAVELHTPEQSGAQSASCKAGKGYETLVNTVWPWVDAAVYSFIPFILLIIMNSFIIRACVSAMKQRRCLQCQRPTRSASRSDSRSSLYNKRKQRRSLPSQSSAEGQSGHNGGRNSTEKKRLMMTLLAVSFTFMITALPMNILLILTAKARDHTDSDTQELQFAKFTLARTIVVLLMYVNHTANFFCYCLSGTKFRREVAQLIKRSIRSISRRGKAEQPILL